MSTSDDLRAFAEQVAPIYARWIDCNRRISILLMQAWDMGLLDEAWAQLRPLYHDHSYLHYFIRARGTGDIKIGKSNAVGVRFKMLLGALSRGGDLLACYPGGHEHESELHDEFKHIRLYGEWFIGHTDLLEYLRMLGSNVDAIIASPPILTRHARGRRRNQNISQSVVGASQ